MSEYIHIMPKKGFHIDSGRASDCPCEPEIQTIEGVPWLRVAVHRGVGPARVAAEMRILNHAYSLYREGKDA